MSMKAVPCPECGSDAAGKFCGQCGARLVVTCSSCGTSALAGARFCQECGAPLGARRKKEAVAPWVALGAAGVFLAVIGGLILLDRQDRQDGAAPPRPQSAPAPRDPSTLEVAEQLFNRAMAASESGDAAEARRVAPLALDAYQRLGALDNDGRYHVGLLHVTLGDIGSAQGELDAIRRAVPAHLLGIQLEHAIAEAKGDGEGVARAYSRFLAAYDAEIALDRPEYRDHRRGIDGFRARADAATALR